MENIIKREFKRVVLIILSPILFPLWIVIGSENTWEKVLYYWKSVFKKDLNLKQNDPRK